MRRTRTTLWTRIAACGALALCGMAGCASAPSDTPLAVPEGVLLPSQTASAYELVTPEAGRYDPSLFRPSVPYSSAARSASGGC